MEPGFQSLTLRQYFKPSKPGPIAPLSPFQPRQSTFQLAIRRLSLVIRRLSLAIRRFGSPMVMVGLVTFDTNKGN